MQKKSFLRSRNSGAASRVGKALVVCFVFTLLGLGGLFAQHPPLGGGSGSSGSPYEIATAAHLKALADYVNAGNGESTAGVHYKLMNDIDLSSYASGEGWEPIGMYISATDTSKAFQGVFDGNNRAVRNLTIDRDTSNFIGLFGFVIHSTIQNLGIVNCDVSGKHYVSGLVGCNYTSATISNCSATGNVKGSGNNVGGLVGRNYSTITNCYATGNVEGVSSIGGLVGQTDSATTITKCHSACDVVGSSRSIGGLLGYGYYSTITECYATGNATSTGTATATNDGYVGGLIGNCWFSTVTNSYATGNVSGQLDNTGGLTGCHVNGSCSNCYATGDVTGKNVIGGLIGMLANANTTVQNCYASGKVSGFTSAGGVLGYIQYSAIIQNCVAANDSVIISGNNNNCSRIIGGIGGGTNTYRKNYALRDIILYKTYNNVVINNPDDASRNGTRTSLDTLQSLDFYNDASYWYNNAWDINDPSGVWQICDGFTLPFLRWQGIICDYTFVPVTNIINVPTTAIAEVELTLTGTVVPNNATKQKIVWSISTQDDGSTFPNIVGDELIASLPGTVKVTATIVNGIAIGTNYTQDFTVTVISDEDYVPVADITGVPATATVGTPLTLTATVTPTDATFQTIKWSVKNAGTTGAIISGSTLNTTAAGTVEVTATIENGRIDTLVGELADFVKDFTITVNTVGIVTITNDGLRIYPNPTTGQLRITNYGRIRLLRYMMFMAKNSPPLEGQGWWTFPI